MFKQFHSCCPLILIKIKALLNKILALCGDFTPHLITLERHLISADVIKQLSPGASLKWKFELDYEVCEDTQTPNIYGLAIGGPAYYLRGHVVGCAQEII